MVDVGNVTEDTDFTFAFQANDKDAASLFPPSPVSAASAAVPSFSTDKDKQAQQQQQAAHMQIQCRIEHTYPSGMRCLRVLTSRLPLTADRDSVEAAVRSSLVAEHTVRESAALAQRGNLTVIMRFTVQFVAIVAGFCCSASSYDGSFVVLCFVDRNSIPVLVFCCLGCEFSLCPFRPTSSQCVVCVVCCRRLSARAYQSDQHTAAASAWHEIAQTTEAVH